MKQKRVGTITLGLALIMIGVLIPVSLFFQEYAPLIMKLSPLILVVLGIEILIYTFWFKNEKLHYDGFSVFLAIVVTAVTVSASYISPIVDGVMEHMRIGTQIENRLEEDFEQTMLDMNIGGSVRAYANREYPDVLLGKSTEKVPYVTLMFKLQYIGDNKQDATMVANDIEILAKKLLDVKELNSASFSVMTNGYSQTEIMLYPGNLWNVTASDIEKQLMESYDDYEENR